MRTPQEILTSAAQTAGITYVSKAEAEAGMTIPVNQKTWMQTLKDAIAQEEHNGDSSDVIMGIDVQDVIDKDDDNSEKWQNAGVEVSEKALELETA